MSTLKSWRLSLISLRSISEVPLLSVQSVPFGLDPLVLDFIIFEVGGRLLERLISELVSSEISVSSEEPRSVLSVVLALMRHRSWVFERSVISGIEVSRVESWTRSSEVEVSVTRIAPSTSPRMWESIWMSPFSPEVILELSWRPSSHFLSFDILIEIRVESLSDGTSSLLIDGLIVVVVEDWVASVIVRMVPSLLS